MSALLRLSAQRCDLEQVFESKLGEALIFPDDERLKAADDARGDAKFKRVSRESPGAVFLRKGAGTPRAWTRGRRPSSSRARATASSRPPRSGCATLLSCVLLIASWRRHASTDVAPRRHRRDTPHRRQARQDRPGPPRTAPRPTSRALRADVAEPPASDVDGAARGRAGRARAPRGRQARASRPPHKRALAPLDNAEDAPKSSRKRMADADGIVSKAKQKKAKKKPAAASRRSAHEKTRSRRRRSEGSRDEGDDWDFDNGVLTSR